MKNQLIKFSLVVLIKTRANSADGYLSRDMRRLARVKNSPPDFFASSNCIFNKCENLISLRGLFSAESVGSSATCFVVMTLDEKSMRGLRGYSTRECSLRRECFAISQKKANLNS